MGAKALEEHSAVWRELERATNPPPFQTYEWARAWFEEVAQDCVPWLITVAGPPGGLLPLALFRFGPLKVLRLMGQGISDYLGPLVPGGDPEVVRALAARVAAERGRWDLLDLGGLWASVSERSALAAGLGRSCRSEPGDICPIVDTRRGWEDYLGGRSKDFRSELRRCGRKIESYGEVAAGREPPSVDLLDELEAVDRASWKWKHGQSFLRDPRLRRFLQRLLLDGRIRSELWTCRVDGTLTAYLIALVRERVRYTYLTAYHPAYSGAGVFLLGRIARASFEEGFSELDLLGGDHVHKLRWADRTRTPRRLISSSGSWRGRLALGALALRSRFPPSDSLRRARLRLEHWAGRRAARRRPREATDATEIRAGAPPG